MSPKGGRQWNIARHSEIRFYAKYYHQKEECDEIYRACCSARFKDSNPHEIYHILLDEGVYLASESSFYRILRQKKAITHRRNTKEGISRSKPEQRIATASNNVVLRICNHRSLWPKRNKLGIYENESDEHSIQLFTAESKRWQSVYWVTGILECNILHLCKNGKAYIVRFLPQEMRFFPMQKKNSLIDGANATPKNLLSKNMKS